MPTFIPNANYRPAPDPFHFLVAPGQNRNAVVPPSPRLAAAIAARNAAAPQANDRGLVPSPTASTLVTGASPSASSAKKAPKVVVKIHPNGHVEIHHTTPADAATSAATAGNLGSAPRGGKPQVDAQGRTDTTLNKRVPTATAPAPALTLEQQAQQLIDYATKAASDPINARIKDQQAAITGSTRELADLMAKYGPASKAIYGGAQQGLAAVNAATGDTLVGQGQSGQDALAAKLAAIDADPATAARLNGTAAANTAGAVGAMAGRGSSALSSLISSGAAAQDMGAKLPGIAGEFGLQATRTAQRQGTTDLANAASLIGAKYPDILQSLKLNAQQQRSNDTSRAAAITQMFGKVTPAAAKLLGIPAGTPTLSAKNATAAANRATNAQANTDRNYKLAQKRLGLSEKRLQEQHIKDENAAKTKGRLHGLSQHEYQTASSTALGLARIAHTPTADGHPPVSWQQFLNGGLSKKVPMWILIEQGKRVYSQPEIRKGLIPKAG